jgi:7-carboxy-7-deazaguanine synthase
VNLYVNELYPCILGESLQAGLPAALVRLAGCNLDCCYCDTRHASQEPGREMAADAVCREVLSMDLPRVLITGGEPLLQKEGLAALCHELAAEGIEILVETNGTLPVSDAPPDAMLVVDVKTPGAKARVPFAESNLALLSPEDQLKFVLTGEADYRWALRFLAAHRVPVPPGNVLLSPAWGSLAPQTLAQWILHDRLPYRFHMQMHKVVWGERRGT